MIRVCHGFIFSNRLAAPVSACNRNNNHPATAVTDVLRLRA
jgi:hypothetical protein